MTLAILSRAPRLWVTCNHLRTLSSQPKIRFSANALPQNEKIAKEVESLKGRVEVLENDLASIKSNKEHRSERIRD